GNLLAVFVPLLDAVCTNPSRYGEPALLTAATLSLAKFMTLSPQLCESRLRLLFTVLERSSLPGVRANTMVALGDLAFRFPNLLEPWTAHLYARLKDDCAVVRSCSLRVLAHLVVSDMVKVRGHISNVAALLVDKDPSIASQARAFFTELAKKDNALYNALPDIVSRLSDPEEGIAEEPFHTVMRQLFSYIQKDRQVESLVEKLCHRFRTTSCERQWRELAFCLGELPWGERATRRLLDNFSCVSDKLADPRLYTALTAATQRQRKAGGATRPEHKALLDELEERLDLAHRKGLEEGGQPPPLSPSRPLPHSQEGEEEEGGRGSKAARSGHRARPHKPRQRRAALEWDSDLENTPPLRTRGEGPASRGARGGATPSGPARRSQRTPRDEAQPRYTEEEQEDGSSDDDSTDSSMPPPPPPPTRSKNPAQPRAGRRGGGGGGGGKTSVSARIQRK
uniref:Condensin complex subunit 1 n=1 Tax=Petromyzon marinus TaxID=7757 RepID=A0AAJ7WJJ1_PETMA